MTSRASCGILYFVMQDKTFIRAISSVGQSYRLITGWSWVRVPDGPPNFKPSAPARCTEKEPAAAVGKTRNTKRAGKQPCSFCTGTGAAGQNYASVPVCLLSFGVSAALASERKSRVTRSSSLTQASIMASSTGVTFTPAR